MDKSGFFGIDIANGDTAASIAAEVGFEYSCSPQQQRKEKRQQKKRDSQMQKALKRMSAELSDDAED